MLINKIMLSLGKLVSKEESRYTLNSIAVERDSATVTNGHYLVNVTAPKFPNPNPEESYPVTVGLEHRQLAENERVLIPAQSCDAAIKALKTVPKNLKTVPVLAHAALGMDKKIYVNTIGQTASFDANGEGQFPNWRYVVPTEQPKAEICITAEYLALLGKFFADSNDSKNPLHVRITVTDDVTALRFDARTADGQDIMALCMPLRSDKTQFAARPWDVAQAEKKAAKAAKEQAAKAASESQAA